jgi:hypothetical protein
MIRKLVLESLSHKCMRKSDIDLYSETVHIKKMFHLCTVFLYYGYLLVETQILVPVKKRQ